MANWYKRLPNWLTFLRLALIPVFVFFLLNPTPDSLRIAAVIFVFAALTDYADGILARRYAAITDFGKLFDPLADKILVMSALVMLIGVQDSACRPIIPAWMVVLILARELWITGLRAFAAKDGTVVSAKSGGKVKSALQMISILALLLHEYSATILGFHVPMQFVGLNLLVISLVFSYISAIDYSLAIFAPERGSLADITKQVGEALLATSAANDQSAPAVENESVQSASLESDPTPIEGLKGVPGPTDSSSAPKDEGSGT
jgi:CDP-diacylglycerol--glycerol-3-phosphate 3-phosphatidyltransferase